MRIAITGGSGFVGLAAAEALVQHGHDVTLLDLSPPPADFASHGALRQTRFHRADVRDAGALGQALATARPDVLIHMAALTANDAMEKTAAAAIIAVNVGGTATVIEAAARQGCRRIISLSSIAVYGARGGDFGGRESIDETTSRRPDTLYGITKSAAEDVARRLAELHGLDLTILRLGPIFGAWEHPGDARPDLSPHAQILAQTAPRLAHEMRADWLYSRDAGAAIAKVAEKKDLGVQTFNLGAGRMSSLLEWAEAAGLASPEMSPGAATVTLRTPRSRPPLAIDRLRDVIDYVGTRPLSEAAADHMAWLQTLTSKTEQSIR